MAEGLAAVFGRQDREVGCHELARTSDPTPEERGIGQMDQHEIGREFARQLLVGSGS
jgi:hypothetical protein